MNISALDSNADPAADCRSVTAEAHGWRDFGKCRMTAMTGDPREAAGKDRENPAMKPF
jgi:hypothetical protein